MKDDFEKLLEDEVEAEEEKEEVKKIPPLTTSLGDLLADWKKKQEKK